MMTFIISEYVWEPYCFATYVVYHKTIKPVKPKISEEMARDIADERNRYSQAVKELTARHQQKIYEIETYYRDKVIRGLTNQGND